MSMTDPIADLLTRIRNAQIARHSELSLPASRMKLSIVGILKSEGYIDSFEHDDSGPQGSIKVVLKYDREGTPAISGMERVSRPGRRIYRGKDGIPKVLNGLGVAILSTPQGVMTGTESEKAGIGGEILCSIW